MIVQVLAWGQPMKKLYLKEIGDNLNMNHYENCNKKESKNEDRVRTISIWLSNFPKPLTSNFQNFRYMLSLEVNSKLHFLGVSSNKIAH